MLKIRVPVLLLSAALIYAAAGYRLTADSPKSDADAPFNKELLQVAKDYKGWGRVDDEMHWAPFLCREPQPGKAAFSASTDEATHGQKIYSLFAKKRNDYVQIAATKTAPVGQVIVKESWIPEETEDNVPSVRDLERKKVIETKIEGDHFYPYATTGGKMYKAAKLAGLFVMMKLDPKTPGTDDGWVYGTVSADGKKVTAAGKVESCMKCHVEAKFDRQFGSRK
jgi:hypothetical protein